MTLITDPTVEVSSGSEHYKRLTEHYIMYILEHMKRVGIDITFHNVVELLDPEKLKVVMDQMHVAPEEQGVMHKMIDAHREDVHANVAKLVDKSSAFVRFKPVIGLYNATKMVPVSGTQ